MAPESKTQGPREEKKDTNKEITHVHNRCYGATTQTLFIPLRKILENSWKVLWSYCCCW